MVRSESFRLDAANAVLWRGEVAIPPAPKPFEVLCHLVSHAGALVTKDELLDAVWPGLHVGESSLSFAINAIRPALSDNARAPVYIQTVQRRGYRFIAKVEAIPSSAILPSLDPGAAATACLAPERPRWRVGRTAPLEQVEALLPLVSAGHRQLVFVIGEPGIGKTTFIEMVTERFLGDGIYLLTGRCTEWFGTNEAFLPLIEVLQAYCSGPDGPGLLKALRENAPTWLAQMPTFLDAHDRATFQSELAGSTRERMLREFCDLTEALGANRRRVIIIEDLHWIDLATIDVLSHFSRRNKPVQVLILVTYRPADVAMAGHPVRIVHHNLHIRGHCKDIELGRLTRNDVRNYLSLRFNDAASTEAITDEIFRRTGGQPLFVVSLVDYFVDKHVLVEVNGCWHLDVGHKDIRAGIPWEVRDMITRQIDALALGQRQILEVASAVSADFSAAAAAAAVAYAISRDVVEVEQAFEAMAGAGQIVAGAGVSEWPDGTALGHYAFQHDLYREVVYDRLAPVQLVRTHRCIGEELEKAYQSRTVELAPVLALHFENGRDLAKAIHYLGQAAENAAQRLASREATNYLTRALGLVDRLPP